jgi:hypothetical protein
MVPQAMAEVALTITQPSIRTAMSFSGLVPGSCQHPGIRPVSAFLLLDGRRGWYLIARKKVISSLHIFQEMSDASQPVALRLIIDHVPDTGRQNQMCILSVRQTVHNERLCGGESQDFSM